MNTGSFLQYNTLFQKNLSLFISNIAKGVNFNEKIIENILHHSGSIFLDVETYESHQGSLTNSTTHGDN
jgi:hypothetical protein